MSLKLSNKCQDGNLQSVFSCLDIIWTLYDKVMHWSPESALDDNRDFFLISKGQATLALFPILIKRGFFKWEELNEIGKFDSKFCIQADISKFKGGVENAAGSLGHGLPMAAGIAMANKIRKSPSRVFVLTGDGEFMEGSMWESCLFASAKKLDNLCVIIDDNDSAGDILDMGNMQAKLEAFGFEVHHVNGHDLSELENVLALSPKTGMPRAVIAHTARGFGSPTMTNHDVWFHKAPNDEELNVLIKEVEAF
jgi:transketolase